MNYNTQNAKIASITEKTLIVGIDVGSETHYARAFNWRNYEYSKKPFAFSNDEAGFASFKAWMDDMAGETWDGSDYSRNGTNRPLLAEPWSVPAGTGNEAGTCESTSC